MGMTCTVHTEWMAGRHGVVLIGARGDEWLGAGRWAMEES